MSTFKEIREKLESQICELEALQSVYPEELTIADHGNLADVNEFVSGNCDSLPSKLEYSIQITIPKVFMKTVVIVIVVRNIFS